VPVCLARVCYYFYMYTVHFLLINDDDDDDDDNENILRAYVTAKGGHCTCTDGVNTVR